MMNTEDILELDGIVIRKVPTTTTYKWHCKEGDENKTWYRGEGKNRKKINYTYSRNEKGELIKTEVRKNSYAGYLITFNFTSGQQVQFCKKTFGHGKTIPEAYQNYLDKQSM